MVKVPLKFDLSGHWTLRNGIQCHVVLNKGVGPQAYISLEMFKFGPNPGDTVYIYWNERASNTVQIGEMTFEGSNFDLVNRTRGWKEPNKPLGLKVIDLCK